MPLKPGSTGSCPGSQQPGQACCHCCHVKGLDLLKALIGCRLTQRSAAPQARLFKASQTRIHWELPRQPTAWAALLTWLPMLEDTEPQAHSLPSVSQSEAEALGARGTLAQPLLPESMNQLGYSESPRLAYSGDGGSNQVKHTAHENLCCAVVPWRQLGSKRNAVTWPSARNGPGL